MPKNIEKIGPISHLPVISSGSQTVDITEHN